MIKLRDLIKESHTISFTKDEMSLLHRDGQLKKDGHLYVYDESLEERWGHSEHPEDDGRHKVKEDKKRNYKAEYKKFQSSAKSKKYRAELNKYNRKRGTYGNGDGKDASHKGGSIVGYESQSKNRGRAEKSRLKKESGMIKLKDLVVEEKKMGNSHFARMSIAARRIEKEVNKLVKDWRKYGGPKYGGGVPERLNDDIEKLRSAASKVEGSFDFIGKDPDDYVTNVTKDFIKW